MWPKGQLSYRPVQLRTVLLLHTTQHRPSTPYLEHARKQMKSTLPASTIALSVLHSTSSNVFQRAGNVLLNSSSNGAGLLSQCRSANALYL